MKDNGSTCSKVLVIQARSDVAKAAKYIERAVSYRHGVEGSANRSGVHGRTSSSCSHFTHTHAHYTSIITHITCLHNITARLNITLRVTTRYSLSLLLNMLLTSFQTLTLASLGDKDILGLKREGQLSLVRHLCALYNKNSNYGKLIMLWNIKGLWKISPV